MSNEKMSSKIILSDNMSREDMGDDNMYSEKRAVLSSLAFISLFLMLYIFLSGGCSYLSADNGIDVEHDIYAPGQGTNKASEDQRIIAGCMNRSFRELIYKIGRQGGFLFEDDGSLSIDKKDELKDVIKTVNISVFSNHGHDKVPVMISRFEDYPIADVPYYPCFEEDMVEIERFIESKGRRCYEGYYHHSREDFLFGVSLRDSYR